jgi:hypothetical protein
LNKSTAKSGASKTADDSSEPKDLQNAKICESLVLWDPIADPCDTTRHQWNGAKHIEHLFPSEQHGAPLLAKWGQKGDRNQA